MANVSVVQITVWLDDEQYVEIVANSAIATAEGAVIQPCDDPMDFSRTDSAQGVAGADIRTLLDEICGKLSAAVKLSSKTIEICTQGAEIVTCPKP
jgi:hypothetical protein